MVNLKLKEQTPLMEGSVVELVIFLGAPLLHTNITLGLPGLDFN